MYDKIVIRLKKANSPGEGGDEVEPVVDRLGSAEPIAKPTSAGGFFLLSGGLGMKALFVGGSEELSETISLILKVRWSELSLLHATEAKESLELIHREQPDIVMLQHGVPSVDCFDLITQIRSFADVPIIVLGQSDDVVDKVRALEMGADDWIARDCMPMEFIAKVTAILRRCPPCSNDHAVSFLGGKLRINYAAHEVCVLGKPVRLTPIEYKLLCQLARNEGSVVSSAELLRCVWGPNYETDKEILKISICRLRAKIEEEPANPQIVLSERGVGYVIRGSDLS